MCTYSPQSGPLAQCSVGESYPHRCLWLQLVPFHSYTSLHCDDYHNVSILLLTVWGYYECCSDDNPTAFLLVKGHTSVSYTISRS